MNTLHPLFTLRHPRRFWLTSLAIALICAIVLAFATFHDTITKETAR